MTIAKKAICALAILLSISLASCSKNDSSETNEDSESIVIYFSATGTTKAVAEKIQAVTESDIYRIEPKVAYTSEDLNYNDSESRATKEQNDPTARPEIGSEAIDLSKYGTIYLGYCIWWGQAPKIMYTFVETYSLKDKTIYPFVTSGSSPVGTSASNLAKAADGGTWKEGVRFTSSVNDSQITEWITK